MSISPIDPKMIEVIDEWDGLSDVQVIAQRLHDAWFRRVPSEDDIAKAIVDSVPDIKITHAQNALTIDITATLDTYPIAQAIRKLMIGEAQGVE